MLQNPELYGFFLNNSPKRHPKFSIVKLIFLDLVILISFDSGSLREHGCSWVGMGVFPMPRPVFEGEQGLWVMLRR